MVNGWKRGNVGSHCMPNVRCVVRWVAAARCSSSLSAFPAATASRLAPRSGTSASDRFSGRTDCAAGVCRPTRNAIAVTPKLVVIDLGADVRFMQKLATAPAIDVKAAQTVFKLPLEGFSDALAEVDACYSTLMRSASNPFAPAESPKTASAK